MKTRTRLLYRLVCLAFLETKTRRTLPEYKLSGLYRFYWYHWPACCPVVCLLAAPLWPIYHYDCPIGL